jgi:thiol-disulfide isomerase/thioredoxin
MTCAVTIVTLAACAMLTRAAEPTLKVGDPAPKLQTGKWVQGDPVKDFQKGKAYIVEFWATWCGPCRASIPHVNELYNQFKDKGLVVIGQNCWEKDESLVAPFVKKMGDKMTYRVALDDKSSNSKGAMATSWMAAAGRKGIPSAFLVDTKGRIAWIGHPMQLKDQMIEDALAGKSEVSKAD